MHARLCRQLKPGHSPCRAVAVSGSRFCRAHHELLQRQRRIERSSRPPAIRLGALNDRGSIQRAIGRVVQGLANQSLNLDRAPAMLERLRNAMLALDQQDRIEHPVPSLEPPAGSSICGSDIARMALTESPPPADPSASPAAGSASPHPHPPAPPPAASACCSSRPALIP